MSGSSFARRGLFRRLIQRTTSQMAIAPGHVRMIVADADGKRKARALESARQMMIGRQRSTRRLRISGVSGVSIAPLYASAAGGGEVAGTLRVPWRLLRRNIEISRW